MYTSKPNFTTGQQMNHGPGNTHTKRAMFTLRQQIVDGELPGGTRLYEVALAEKLQISRTPVREAMSRLAEEGLLDRANGGGFVVRSFTFQDVVDAIELRGILEGTLARLTAERGADPDRLAQIAATADKLDTCFGADGMVDFDAYAELNDVFHEQLSALCPSDILRRELERTKSLPFASPSAFLPERMDVATLAKTLAVAQHQHKALLAAIEAREGTRAESICREHARIARSNLEYVLKEGSEMIEKVPSLAIVVE